MEHELLVASSGDSGDGGRGMVMKWWACLALSSLACLPDYTQCYGPFQRILLCSQVRQRGGSFRDEAKPKA